MTYLLLGKLSLIEKKINDILAKEESYSLIKYDLTISSIRDVLEDINTINLFDEKKVIICNNFYNIDDEEELLKYLQHQNENIIFFTDEKKINELGKIVKKMQKYISIIETTPNDLTNYVKEMFKDYEINNMAISLLKDYCNDDYNQITNEINKLKMYKLEEKKITTEDIKKIVKKGFDKTIFNLLDAIDKKNRQETFKIYYELLNNNEDEIKIISILASNYKLIYQIKELTKNYNDEECIKLLGKMHPYRFKLLKEKGYSYTSKELLDNIKNLSELDIKIKTGVIDKKTGLELFLADYE